MKFDNLTAYDFREAARLYPGNDTMQYLYCVQLETLRVLVKAVLTPSPRLPHR
jgi:hypothetical protein